MLLAGRNGSEIPEQAAVSLDSVVHAATPQRIPDDRLLRRHDVDAEFALERLDGACSRPMRRRQQDRVGIRVLAHQLAPQLDGRMLRDAADLVEGAAPPGGTQDLAAKMERIAGNAI